MKVVVRVTGEGLVPVDRHQSGLLEKFKLGDLITIRITKDRNPLFHRKFFAMLAETFDMQDQFQNKEQWRHAVTVGAGWCDYFKVGNKLVAVPRSISFENMDDDLEFQNLYEDVIGHIEQVYVQGDPGHLHQLLEFL